MKNKLKLTIDLCMTAGLLLCMAYLLIGETVHEIVGTAMLAMFILHHVLNAKWYGALGKGKYSAARVFQTVVDFLSLAAILGLGLSAVVLSRTVFSWVSLPALLGTARVAHLLCSYWGFVLMSLHLGLHWGTVMSSFKKHSLPAAGRWVLRIIVFCAAAYGLTAFLRQDIPSYLFLKNQFVFFDLERPLILFFLDEIAMMTLWAAAAYYLRKIFTRKGKN